MGSLKAEWMLYVSLSLTIKSLAAILTVHTHTHARARARARVFYVDLRTLLRPFTALMDMFL